MTHVKLAIAVGGESREDAVETAATSKEGNRRATCFDTGRPLCVFLHRRRRREGRWSGVACCVVVAWCVCVCVCGAGGGVCVSL